MPRPRYFRRLFRIPLPAARQAERDIDDELRLHLELRTEELMNEGRSEEEARREALRAFGDPERARRELLGPDRRHLRLLRGGEWLRDVVRDLRLGGRSLVRAPAFSTIAVLTLALGIGATTALFSVVDSVLLEPLPFPAANELAMIFEAHEERGGADRNVVNPGNFKDWRTRARSFESMAAIYQAPVTVLAGEEPREVTRQLVHPDYFRALGLAPRLGRVFTLEDGASEEEQLVVLSDAFWREHFNADLGVIGQKVALVGGSLQVIGVMPPALEVFAGDVAFWTPSDYAWGNREDMGRFVTVVGRLRDGVSLEAARQEIQAIAAALRTEYPDFNARWSANVVALDEHLSGDVRPAMLIVLGAVTVLLLIACVNVANLLLVRAASRRVEIAVRASLGAGRARIARGLVLESLVLAAAGGVLGIGVAYAATRALVAGVPESLRIPRLQDATVDGSVLAFAAAAALITGLLFGIAPLAEAFRTSLSSSLREGGRGTGPGRRAQRLRTTLVIAEVALSLVLLAGAGLLLRSFKALQRTDLGFRAEQVVTGRVTLRGEQYDEAAARIAFFDEVLGTVDAEPSVEAAGLIWWLPLSGLRSATDYYLPDRPRPAPGEAPGTQVQAVQGDLFRALGVPLLQGRTFDSRDRADAARTVIVNRAFAAQAWPGQTPIGRRVVMPWGEDLDMEVIGVVGDTRHMGVEQIGEPTLYLPHAQFPEVMTANLIARTSGSLAALQRRLPALVQQVDPLLAVADVRPMEEVVADAVARPRLTSLLVGLFAALALVLAAIGIYGVVSYAVVLRMHELGVRRALGAQTSDVAGMVVRDALRLGAAGIFIGIAIAFFATRILQSLLYNVEPGDPLVLVGTAALLLAVTTGAALVPALRASRVSPTEAIRYD